jgi:hypothetical protein
VLKEHTVLRHSQVSLNLAVLSDALKLDNENTKILVPFSNRINIKLHIRKFILSGKVKGSMPADVEHSQISKPLVYGIQKDHVVLRVRPSLKGDGRVHFGLGCS